LSVDSFLLRKRLNVVENEKLDAVSAANQEVSELLYNPGLHLLQCTQWATSLFDLT